MNGSISKSIRAAYSRHELLLAATATAVVTILSLMLVPLTGYVAIALLYLLLVVVAGLKLTRWTVLLIATASAVLWNFLFIPPQYTIYIDNIEDLMLFAMFFVVAIAMGHVTTRLRESQVAQQQRERRTSTLYELVRQAGLAPDLDAGLCAAMSLIETIFGVRAALLLRLQDHTLSRTPHPASSLRMEAPSLDLAQTAFARQTAVGKFTDTMPESDAMHLPLKAHTAVMGVLTVAPALKGSFDPAEIELLETFAVLIGTILERDHLLAAFKDAEILEASERLHRALLQSVSHELKTPLAAVQTGIDALASGVMIENKKRITIQEIQSASRRLQRVIDNLLNMSRIESGAVKPKLDWCDVGELIEAAVQLAGDTLSDHQIIVEGGDNLPMVKIDQALLEQCLCNLLLNSASWSPPGSKITVAARLKDGSLILSVEDEGKGIRESEIDHIFDVFYRGADARPGGTGLGLAIVDGFVRAHSGKVHAANRQPRGAEFAITIPAETLSSDLMEELA
jgi:two-component system, OmpR family, sensor histidine kinase KdpD